MCLCILTFADQIPVRYRTSTSRTVLAVSSYSTVHARISGANQKVSMSGDFGPDWLRRRCCLYVKHHLLIRSLADFASIGRVGPEGVTGASITRLVGYSELLERFLVSGSSTNYPRRNEGISYPKNRDWSERLTQNLEAVVLNWNIQ
jgi:hypothetical protein